MITPKANYQAENTEKSVVILAECWHGALNAGRFAVKHLFDDRTRIVLLQTYQRPAFGRAMLRNITPMLKRIAMEELTELKDKLLKEFNIPAERIDKLAVEGELNYALEHELDTGRNISLVLGADGQESSRKMPCRKIIRSIRDSQIRPAFLITDCITLIESTRVLVVAETKKAISQEYLNVLSELSGDTSLPVEIITGECKKDAPIHKSTAIHFSNRLRSLNLKLNSTETVLHERVIRVSPITGFAV